MEAIGKYKRAMALAERIKKRVLSEIQKEIMAIPDLKGVKRIDSGVYGFMISSSDFSSESWLPQYYDNKKIASDICERIEKMRTIEAIEKYLNEVITTRKVNGYRINPEITEKLKEIMKGLN